MEIRLNLPDVDAVKEFVKTSGTTENIVLVTKEGYRYEVDGESFLGMMSMLGENILVKFNDDEDIFKTIIERYGLKKEDK